MTAEPPPAHLASPSTLDEVQTPALLLDLARLERNIERIEARCRALGVRLRPHLKTAKSLEIARRIPSAFEHGITVSTAKEAEYFAAGGVRDVLYAVTVAPAKLPRLARVIADTGARLTLAVDSELAARAVAAAGAAAGVTFDVLIEIDSGEHRSGVAPDDERLASIAAWLRGAAGARLRGVYTHAGHSYGCRGAAALRVVAEQERAAVVHTPDLLAAHGHELEVVSVGSTPTLTHVEHLEGVTEARAGVYVFGDMFQAGLGTCAVGDVAVTVLASVIGQRPEQGRVLIDAGGLALSKDRSTAALGGAHDVGYGAIADRHGARLAGAAVVDAYQEHGVVAAPGPLDLDALPIGARLRVLPNHACMTSAAYDQYHVVDGERVVAIWPRINEWV